MPFKRCLACNGFMESVKKEGVVDQLEPKTKMYYNEFYSCKDCKKIYWKGSHFGKLIDVVNIYRT